MTTHRFAHGAATELLFIASVFVNSLSPPIPLSGDNDVPLIISLVEGTGDVGFSGDGGQAADAGLSHPTTVAVDGAGRVFITDEANQRIRVVDTDGAITTLSGYGDSGGGGDGVLATAAQLQYPSGVAVDTSGNVYIGCGENCRVRRVDASAGCITTVAGACPGTCLEGQPATTQNLTKVFDVDSPDGHILIAFPFIHVVAIIPATSGTLYGQEMIVMHLHTLEVSINQQDFSGDGGPANYTKLINQATRYADIRQDEISRRSRDASAASL